MKLSDNQIRIMVRLIIFAFSILIIIAAVMKFSSNSAWTPLKLVWNIYEM